MGIRQKLGLKKETRRGGNTSFQLIKSWFKKGKLSGPDVQQVSSSIKASYRAKDKGMKRLANAGTGGKHRNVHRDVMRTFNRFKDGVSADVYEALVPFWDKNQDKQVFDRVHVLIPYETIDAAIDSEMQAKQLINPPLEDWCSIQEGDTLRATKIEWMQRCGIDGNGDDFVCCGLWGDGAPYHTRDSLNLLLFNVLSGIHRVRMWIGAWSKRSACQCGCKGKCTSEAFFSIITWVAMVWSTKLYPSFRHDGVRFSESSRPGDAKRAAKAADGKRMWTRGGFLQFRGDWDFYKNVLALCGWVGEGIMKRCCFKCLANKTVFPFNDPTLHALWRGTTIDHALFMQMAFSSGCFLSFMFSILGFRYDYVSVDLMHTGDLGVLLFVFGYLLYELFHEMGGIVTRSKSTLSDILGLIRFAAMDLNVNAPINNLTFGMIKQPKGSPKLKVKAAESRYLLPIITRMFEKIVPRTTPHQKLRFNCVFKLDQFYKKMRAPLAEFDALSTAKLCREAMILYSELGRPCSDGYAPWKWYPKCHLMGHIEMQIITSGSPEKSWCYSDEAAIGDAVDVAESCHASTLHRLVIQKYRCYLLGFDHCTAMICLGLIIGV